MLSDGGGKYLRGERNEENGENCEVTYRPRQSGRQIRVRLSEFFSPFSRIHRIVSPVRRAYPCEHNPHRPLRRREGAGTTNVETGSGDLEGAWRAVFHHRLFI